MQVEPVPLKRILQAALIAGLGSTAANVVVWLIGSAIGRMNVGLAEVVVLSVLGVLAGAIVYALLARFTRKPNTIFVIICIVVLVVYAFGPIAAAQTPFMEGAAPFNTLTVVATELMHLISGAFVIIAFARLSRTA